VDCHLHLKSGSYALRASIELIARPGGFSMSRFDSTRSSSDRLGTSGRSHSPGDGPQSLLASLQKPHPVSASSFSGLGEALSTDPTHLDGSHATVRRLAVASKVMAELSRARRGLAGCVLLAAQRYAEPVAASQAAARSVPANEHGPASSGTTSRHSGGYSPKTPGRQHRVAPSWRGRADWREHRFWGVDLY